MKFVTYIKEISDLLSLPSSFEGEVILAHQQFSTLGDLNDESARALIEACKNRSIPMVWEWDILMTESQLEEKKKEMEEGKWASLFSTFKAVRVQDLGAMEWLRREFPEVKIQLICEAANHNLLALKTWEKVVGKQLDRLIVSSELSLETVKNYYEQLTTPLEFLVLGPILLFYTPRALLSAISTSSGIGGACGGLANKKKMMTAESEESGHKGFRLTENQHGTFMFYPKDISRLDFIDDFKADEFKKMWGRVDFRHLNLDLKQLFSLLFSGAIDQIKESYPLPLMQSVFKANRSDTVFKRLKNSHLDRKMEGLLGEVVEVHKGKWMGIRLKDDPNVCVEMGQTIHFFSPYGKEYFLEINEKSRMVNSRLQPIMSAKGGELFYVKALRGVSPRTLVKN